MKILFTRRMAFSTFAIALLVVGCSKNSLPDDQFDPAEIRLRGGLQVSENVNVRGVGPIEGDKPAHDLSLAIFRANEPYSDAYTSTPVDGTMAAETGVITFYPTQYYPTNGCKTKLIGLYPAGDEYTPSERTVIYSTPNGSTDIMAGDLVEGCRSKPINGKMTFGHLLTQVQVYVKAKEDAVAAAWGKITGITIVDKKEGYVVTLPKPSVGGLATIASTGEIPGELPLTTAEGGAIGPFGLNTNFRPYGYAMFLPVTNDEELTLSITTENGGTQELAISSDDDDIYEAGKAYKIKITFKGAFEISVSASLTPWDDGGIKTGTLGED